MKTKAALSTKKQSVTVKDLTTRKNPKGGVVTNPFGTIITTGGDEKRVGCKPVGSK